METGHVIVFLLNIAYCTSLLQQVHQWHNPLVITASFKPTDLIFCPVYMYEAINITDVAKISSTSPHHSLLQCTRMLWLSPHQPFIFRRMVASFVSLKVSLPVWVNVLWIALQKPKKNLNIYKILGPLKENPISYLGHQPFPKRPTNPLSSNLRVNVSKLKNTLKSVSVRGELWSCLPEGLSGRSEGPSSTLGGAGGAKPCSDCSCTETILGTWQESLNRWTIRYLSLEPFKFWNSYLVHLHQKE